MKTKNVGKFTAHTASRLIVTLAIAAAAGLIWEGFNALHPPQTGSLRAWAFDLWQNMTRRS